MRMRIFFDAANIYDSRLNLNKVRHFFIYTNNEVSGETECKHLC